MSATRDKSQKFAFVYSNLYKIYRDDEANQNHANAIPSAAKGYQSGIVIKTGNLKQASTIAVTPYTPPQFITHRIAPKTNQPAISHHIEAEAIADLKKNLQHLNDLHSRLRFMLKELEELIK
ncbi:MAG: hypothetical protein AABZ06_09815 [Bdellovibrionota bacterium]